MKSSAPKIDAWKAVAAVIDDNHSSERKVYRLKDLGSPSKLPCGPPRVGHFVGYVKSPIELKESVAQFERSLYEFAPYLKGLIALSGNSKRGLVLAGGLAAQALINGVPWKANDADLFMVGIGTPSEVKSALKAVGDHLQKFVKGEVYVYRTTGCVTFTFVHNFRKYQVQVVLRLYKSPHEVIQGFDIGSCSVCYDGSEVWLTEAGKFAMEYNLNVLNLRERRPSYERRLAKYSARGWGLVLPQLGEVGVGLISLPYLRLACGEGDGDSEHVVFKCSCCIRAAIAPARPPEKTNMTHSIYDDVGVYGDSEKTGYEDDYKLTLRNLRAIERGKNVGLAVCGKSEYFPHIDIMKIQPTVTAFDLLSALDKSISVKGLNPHAVLAILGKKRGKLLLDEISGDKWPSLAKMEDLCLARMKELVGLEIWPPKISAGILENSTAPAKGYPEELLTEKEWYGEYFLKD